MSPTSSGSQDVNPLVLGVRGNRVEAVEEEPESLDLREDRCDRTRRRVGTRRHRCHPCSAWKTRCAPSRHCDGVLRRAHQRAQADRERREPLARNDPDGRRHRGILRGRSDPFHGVVRGADRREQLLAVRLVARRDDELDLGLERARRRCPRGGARPRRRCRAPRDEVEDAAQLARPVRDEQPDREEAARRVSPWRSTEMSVVASMFPPERTTATDPCPATRPARSAASPTAPAPSTRSFVRSSRARAPRRSPRPRPRRCRRGARSRIDDGRLARMLDRDPVGDRVARADR